MSKENMGSSIDDSLKEEGIFEEAQAAEGVIAPDVEGGREKWLRLLWISPSILILGICVWHFVAPEITRMKVETAWRQDRGRLQEAYSQMQDAIRHDDLDTYILASQRADSALDSLQTDLGKLAVTVDRARKERFLQGSRDCIADLQFDLSIIPTHSRPSDYCTNLIAKP